MELLVFSLSFAGSFSYLFSFSSILIPLRRLFFFFIIRGKRNIVFSTSPLRVLKIKKEKKENIIIEAYPSYQCRNLMRLDSAMHHD